jgi:hypothetical protein
MKCYNEIDLFVCLQIPYNLFAFNLYQHGLRKRKRGDGPRLDAGRRVTGLTLGVSGHF